MIKEKGGLTDLLFVKSAQVESLVLVQRECFPQEQMLVGVPAS